MLRCISADLLVPPRPKSPSPLPPLLPLQTHIDDKKVGPPLLLPIIVMPVKNPPGPIANAAQHTVDQQCDPSQAPHSCPDGHLQASSTRPPRRPTLQLQGRTYQRNPSLPLTEPSTLSWRLQAGSQAGRTSAHREGTWAGRVKHRLDTGDGHSTVELFSCQAAFPEAIHEQLPPVVFVSDLASRDQVRLKRHSVHHLQLGAITQKQHLKLLVGAHATRLTCLHA